MLSRFFTRRRQSPPPPAPPAPPPGPPAAANDNLKILRPVDDPAYQLRRFRVCLALMRQDNARAGKWQGFLLDRPEYRRFYEEVRAIERAIAWRYFE
jgi:hypothetical protein